MDKYSIISNCGALGRLSIGSRTQAHRHKRNYDAVLTIEDPFTRYNTGVRFRSNPHPDHLIIQFEDLDEPCEYWHAEATDITNALDFARKHLSSDLLIHCVAGRCRSTAIAYAVLCERYGPGRELEALQMVLNITPDAVPTKLVVALADEILGRDGAMLSTSENYIANTDSALRLRMAKAELLDTTRKDFSPSLFARKPT